MLLTCGGVLSRQHQAAIPGSLGIAVRTYCLPVLKV